MSVDINKKVEYICTWCGKREMRGAWTGRPNPGRCPRKEGDKPHTWRINRTIG